MNNKKLSRLLEPNLKLYFVCMVVFAAATATVSLPLGLVEIACTVGLYAYFTKRNQRRRQNILQYIDNVTGSVDTASKSTLINSPLPIMVFRPDTGEVIWSNENFLQLAGVREGTILSALLVGMIARTFHSRLNGGIQRILERRDGSGVSEGQAA